MMGGLRRFLQRLVAIVRSDRQEANLEREAQTRAVLVLVAGKGLTLALAGVVIGSVAAIGATHLVSSLLYGFSGFEPIVLMVACLLLVSLAAIASYLPARRATALDPAVALQQR